jgi:diazepam-binding inhibitor (GABA receptor modulating acyl-CoA-binding protein)
MDQAQAFDAAVVRSRTLPHQPNDVLLELYGLYKQASEGDVAGDRPGGFDFKGAAKYDAWARRRGMTRDEAMGAYVELVDRLAAG